MKNRQRMLRAWLWVCIGLGILLVGCWSIGALSIRAMMLLTTLHLLTTLGVARILVREIKKSKEQSSSALRVEGPER